MCPEGLTEMGEGLISWRAMFGVHGRGVGRGGCVGMLAAALLMAANMQAYGFLGSQTSCLPSRIGGLGSCRRHPLVGNGFMGVGGDGGDQSERNARGRMSARLGKTWLLELRCQTGDGEENDEVEFEHDSLDALRRDHTGEWMGVRSQYSLRDKMADKEPQHSRCGWEVLLEDARSHALVDTTIEEVGALSASSNLYLRETSTGRGAVLAADDDRGFPDGESRSIDISPGMVACHQGAYGRWWGGGDGLFAVEVGVRFGVWRMRTEVRYQEGELEDAICFWEKLEDYPDDILDTTYLDMPGKFSSPMGEDVLFFNDWVGSESGELVSLPGMTPVVRGGDATVEWRGYTDLPYGPAPVIAPEVFHMPMGAFITCPSQVRTETNVDEE